MDCKHRLGSHGLMDDYTNTDLRQMLIRECSELDCSEPVMKTNSKRCIAHAKERRLLLHQVNRTIDIEQFKKSGIVQRLERCRDLEAGRTVERKDGKDGW